MAVSDSQINYILDQLGQMAGVSHKRMFGGVGFFKEGKMFGMLNGTGTFLLKVDESNIQQYLERGMAPFSHNKKTSNMPYYEVPLDIIENRTQLKQWADMSYTIARNYK